MKEGHSRLKVSAHKKRRAAHERGGRKHESSVIGACKRVVAWHFGLSSLDRSAITAPMGICFALISTPVKKREWISETDLHAFEDIR